VNVLGERTSLCESYRANGRHPLTWTLRTLRTLSPSRTWLPKVLDPSSLQAVGRNLRAHYRRCRRRPPRHSLRAHLRSRSYNYNRNQLRAKNGETIPNWVKSQKSILKSNKVNLTYTAAPRTPSPHPPSDTQRHISPYRDSRASERQSGCSACCLRI
jgi:hypothetical protein